MRKIRNVFLGSMLALSVFLGSMLVLSAVACDPPGARIRYLKGHYLVGTQIVRLLDFGRNPTLWIRSHKRPEINRSEEGVVELQYTCPCALSTLGGGIATIPEGPLHLVLASGAQYDVFDGAVAHRFPIPKTSMPAAAE